MQKIEKTIHIKLFETISEHNSARTPENYEEPWVQNVSSTGTFVKNSSMTGWTTGVNGIPSNWAVEDAS